MSSCTDSTLEDCYVWVLERELKREFAQYGTDVVVLSGAVPSMASGTSRCIATPKSFAHDMLHK